MLQCAIDQQLPQLGHLLDPQHDGALGSVQVEGQVAGERIERGQGFAGIDQQGFVVWVGFTVKRGGLGVGLTMTYSSDM